MRIWDIHPKLLCRQHLLGEHRELHGLWNILTKHDGVGGYSRHPETLRWVGKLRALYNRHELLVNEMTLRGYNHKSPLDASLATGDATQSTCIDTPARQQIILAEKPCPCFLRKDSN
ncbi:MAG: pyrimidine dimer DNA glycosylase/endonuclease V [bacterium]|nr:pyrimidine dimer DNA glycosylase/endonuclease V [bacterium]